MSAALQSPFAAGIAALARDDPAAAVPLLRAALASGEGGAYAELNLGMALTALAQFHAAEPHLRHALLALPELPEPGMRLGVIAAMRGDSTEARACYEAVLRRHPQHVPALAGLAALAEKAGALDQAAALLARARAAEPDEPELDFAAARLAFAAEDAALAATLAEAVLHRRPLHVAAAQLLARALLRCHPEAAALALLDRHAAAAPLAPAWALAQGFACAELGQLEPAIAAFQLADTLAPDNPDILGEFGRLLAQQDRPDEALDALLPALAARPANLDFRNLAATLMWRRHRYAEMVAMLQAGIAEFGPHPTLNLNLALVLNAQGRQQEALDAADAAIAQAPGNIAALVNRIAVLPYHETQGTAAVLAAAAADIAAALPVATPLPAAPRKPKPRLRLGLLSGGFGIHPVGWLTLAGLEALPEDRFELTAYSLKPRRDALNARFRARAARWHEVSERDDATLAALIRADEIDILIDMGGYGDTGRPFVLTHRPAAVQLKWVGSQFCTSGLPGVDYMLTDRWETPAGFEPHYSERLLRLPDGYVCYLPPSYAPAVSPLPALRNGHVTFGCFNNLAKLTPTVLRLWARLLRDLPDARLVIRTHALSDPGTLALTRDRFAAAGLPLDRMDLHGGCPHTEMLAGYNAIDIALDPFPYTGGLTVCEALYMGVPVVTLAGDSFAGRHALSHLSNVGLPDWVATDAAGYLAGAHAAAADLPALAAVRATLRQRTLASPLCDAPRFGANLGSALEAAWAAA